jgi:outer membrane immunogenic protein
MGRGAPREVCCEQRSWAGVYLGAFAGYHRSNDKWTSDETFPAENGAIPFELNGLAAGGLIGANMQHGRWIWGVEADFAFLTGDKTHTTLTVPGLAADSVKSELGWNGHVRMRFGVDAGHLMPFVAAGIAFTDTDITIVDGTRSDAHNVLRTGLSLGAGLDVSLHPSWLGRIEFVHDRYATATVASPTQFDSEYFDLRTNTVRGALILKLN